MEIKCTSSPRRHRTADMDYGNEAASKYTPDLGTSVMIKHPSDS